MYNKFSKLFVHYIILFGNFLNMILMMILTLFELIQIFSKKFFYQFISIVNIYAINSIEWDNSWKFTLNFGRGQHQPEFLVFQHHSFQSPRNWYSDNTHWCAYTNIGDSFGSTSPFSRASFGSKNDDLHVHMNRQKLRIVTTKRNQLKEQRDFLRRLREGLAQRIDEWKRDLKINYIDVASTIMQRNSSTTVRYNSPVSITSSYWFDIWSWLKHDFLPNLMMPNVSWTNEFQVASCDTIDFVSSTDIVGFF